MCSKCKHFEIEGVAPSLAIGAVTVCHVLIEGLRSMLSHQHQSLPMDKKLISSKFAALDSDAMLEAVRLFEEAGFATEITQVSISNAMLSVNVQVGFGCFVFGGVFQMFCSPMLQHGPNPLLLLRDIVIRPLLQRR